MKMYAEMRITGEVLNLDAITKAIGRSPSKAWHKGDFRLNQKAPMHFSRWALCTADQETIDVNHVIEVLRRDTLAVAMKFSPIAEQQDAKFEISCAVHSECDDSSPAIYLEKEIINWISSIGAALDIDII